MAHLVPERPATATRRNRVRTATARRGGTPDTTARPAARRRVHRPEHAALVAVCAAYCLVVWWRTPQGMSLTFDEVVYASQLSVDTPATAFAVHRSRGVPLLLAPVVMVTEWPVAMRTYLTLLSSLLMYLAFHPWLGVFARPQGRFRYAPAVAAGVLATLWTAQLWATMAYPNLPLAFLVVAGVGWFVRALPPAGPAGPAVRVPVGPVVGVAVAFAAAALVRPTDATAAALPLLAAPLLLRRWRPLPVRRWPWPSLAVLAGLSAGWGAWAAEAFVRFGDPVQRMRVSSRNTSSGLVNSVVANLNTVDGPRLLCRPVVDCGGVEPATAVWWVLLPVLAAAGLVVAARTGWLAGAGLATASAATFTAPYLFLLDYTSPRFLLPTYALLAVPVGGLLVWLVGLGGRGSRAVLTAAVLAVLALHASIQQQVLGEVVSRMESTYDANARVATYLREEHGVRAPCLLWGKDIVALSYLLHCASQWEPSADPPAPDDPVIAAALARGDTVVVRLPAHREPPAFLDRWRLVDPPGDGGQATWLSPVGG